MKTRRDNIFQHNALPPVDSNTFDLSNEYKCTFKMGQLIPSYVREVMPGDYFRLSSESMIRFAPLIYPVMHKVKVSTHWFFVPNRLLWNEWEQWITNNIEVEAPFVTLQGKDIPVSGLSDYIGIPPGEYSTDLRISPFVHAAYLKIFDEYYRDQNLVPETFIPLVQGNNLLYDPVLTQQPLYRAWEHDYFTSCLPFAQKGEVVQVPLTFQDDVPVEYKFRPGGVSNNTGIWMRAGDGSVGGVGTIEQEAGPSPLIAGTTVAGDPIAYNPNGTLVVDIQSDAVDINTLRQAIKLQEWLERNARGGTRYSEHIFAHFGVKSSDARLQRPEYIGGSKGYMTISEVLATAQSESEGVAVGSLAGHGISVNGSKVHDFYAEEHGWVIGILNVQPNTAYQDGIHRSLTRFDPLDYPWPTFQSLGEQEVKVKEIYSLAGADALEDTFGYNPRYSEMRFANSMVAGRMRTTLNFAHMGRIFQTAPFLNDEFITANPTTRCFSVIDDSEDHLFAHIFNNCLVRRKLSRHAIPDI